MSTSGPPTCRDERRRGELFRHRDILGIDFVEVLTETQLCVHLFGEVPPVRDEDHPEGITAANVVVRGGRRIRDLHVLDVRREASGDEERDDCLRVTLDREGDFSTYELCLVGLDHVDPRYTCACFSFRLDCPTGLDCLPAPEPPAAWPP